MTCKLLDQGAKAKHFGHEVKPGVFVARDESGDLTICRHPAGDVRRAPDFELTLTPGEIDEALKAADTVPVRDPDPEEVKQAELAKAERAHKRAVARAEKERAAKKTKRPRS